MSDIKNEMINRKTPKSTKSVTANDCIPNANNITHNINVEIKTLNTSFICHSLIEC